jgi:hypothetical protein
LKSSILNGHRIDWTTIGRGNALFFRFSCWRCWSMLKIMISITSLLVRKVNFCWNTARLPVSQWIEMRSSRLCVKSSSGNKSFVNYLRHLWTIKDLLRPERRTLQYNLLWFSCSRLETKDLWAWASENRERWPDESRQCICPQFEATEWSSRGRENLKDLSSFLQPWYFSK